jgi:hypothetical protein
MVARLFPSADFAIDTGADQTCDGRRTEQKMIDAQARVARPCIAKRILKSIDALLWMQLTQRVSPLGVAEAVRMFRRD